MRRTLDTCVSNSTGEFRYLSATTLAGQKDAAPPSLTVFHSASIDQEHSLPHKKMAREKFPGLIVFKDE